MADDLLPILTRFHREIVLPDIQRVVGDLEGRLEGRFDEVSRHFDAIYQRFDALATEYQLKARVDGLQEQVRVLEERLGA